MRIVMLIDTEGIGGAETAVVNQSLALVRRGWEVEIVCLRNSSFVQFALEHGLKTRVIPMNGRLDISIIRNFKHYIIENKIDLIHSHLFKADIVAALVSKLTSIPCVLTTHGFLAANTNIKPARLWVYEYLNKFIGKSHKKVFAVSRDLQQYWIGKGLSEDKICFVPNSVDCTYFEEPRTPKSLLREKFGIGGNDNDVYFGVVARLSAEKGHEYLLRTVSQLKSNYSEFNAKFLIAGTGSLADSLKELSHSLGLDEDIVFAGHIYDVKQVYQAIDVMILPSVTEGLPLALLEAMSMGKVIIASAVGGVPEVITNMKNGILVNPADVNDLADAISWVIDNFPEAVKFGELAREKIVSDYNLDKVLGTMEQTYLQLLNCEGNQA